MKKRYAIPALAGAALMAFSACGATAASPAASSAASSEGYHPGTQADGVLTVYSPQADADRGPWIQAEAEKARLQGQFSDGERRRATSACAPRRATCRPMSSWVLYRRRSTSSRTRGR